MSILSIDYGDKKVGLAKSVNNTAVPLAILENIGRANLLKKIKKVCADEEVKKIIVGVPLSLASGKIRTVDLENQQMQKVLKFITDLKKAVCLPVEMEDERLSTKQAAGLLKTGAKNKQDDDIAAMLILQSYLDKNSTGL